MVKIYVVDTNVLIQAPYGLQCFEDNQVVLVTKDILLRIKAQIIGIKAEDFQTEQVLGHEAQYRGKM